VDAVLQITVPVRRANFGHILAPVFLDDAFCRRAED